MIQRQNAEPGAQPAADGIKLSACHFARKQRVLLWQDPMEDENAQPGLRTRRRQHTECRPKRGIKHAQLHDDEWAARYLDSARRVAFIAAAAPRVAAIGA